MTFRVQETATVKEQRIRAMRWNWYVMDVTVCHAQNQSKSLPVFLSHSWYGWTWSQNHIISSPLDISIHLPRPTLSERHALEISEVAFVEVLVQSLAGVVSFWSEQSYYEWLKISYVSHVFSNHNMIPMILDSVNKSTFRVLFRPVACWRGRGSSIRNGTRFSF